MSNLDANLREQMRFEIRRVHDETGITMVYVTHDQAEAMVIADQVAVMNAGRIEQIGPPRDIYERPGSRFVASFIGNSNCLACEVVEPGLVRCGGLSLRTADTDAPRAGQATLCIRPAALRVWAVEDEQAAQTNVARGRVVQRAYLGEHQDLRIDLGGQLELRALVPARAEYPAGAEVVVELPAEECRVIPG